MFFFFKAAAIIQLYVFMFRILYYIVNKVVKIKIFMDSKLCTNNYCWTAEILHFKGVKYYKNDIKQPDKTLSVVVIDF